MSVLRFLMMLSLVLWLGGIMFFAFVVAPTLFVVLPSHELAGAVVSPVLRRLHWIGLCCGIAYLVLSLLGSRWQHSWTQPLALRHVLVCLMIVFVLISQFGIGAKMNRLRADMGAIDSVARDDPRRIEFNRLHGWSGRTEGAILVMGLVVLFLTTRRLS